MGPVDRARDLVLIAAEDDPYVVVRGLPTRSALFDCPLHDARRIGVACLIGSHDVDGREAQLAEQGPEVESGALGVFADDQNPTQGPPRGRLAHSSRPASSKGATMGTAP